MLSLLPSELTSGRAFTSEMRIFSAALNWETQLFDYPYLLDFRWVCDDSVTHYIYQGRVGDNSREYRGVKERGLHVVSQYWLHAVCFHVIIMQVVELFKFLANGDLCLVMQCAEEQRRVPESLYPFNYNPKMSLNLSQVPCSSQKSPNRTQRRETTVAKDKMVGPDVTKSQPLIHTD